MQKLKELKTRSIRRVFIANRGEIARRIALGAHTIGIESAAIYSGNAPPAFLEGWVQHFIKVPEESPAIYLDSDLMVQLALQSGSDAVHPGFGFLSENASFAAKVEAAGLVWIGPSPAAIEAMASKAAAREIAKQEGVPVVPGIERLTLDDNIDSKLPLVKGFVQEHGFPILLKAALGGGGKGMRVVRSESELPEAMRRAQSEALNAFGDGSLIIERYVEYPRHVEVQILGDSYGTVYALSDRDCSVQRRHQKIIEEAPAPQLGPKTRSSMHEAAVRLAQSVGYSSAGTVEFLVDWSEDKRQLPEQSFYFLEMNTRLQVEHPVTEEVLNEDLVVWQFRIAQGEAIADRLNLEPQGHSIELRLYAEDAAHGFLPAPGPVHGFLPANLPGIRWEVGIDAIDEITARFDPMICKLISTGSDRAQAIARLEDALKTTVLALPISNVAFLLSVLRHPAFALAAPSTRFIEDHRSELDAWIAGERQRWEALVPSLCPNDSPAASGSRTELSELTQRIFRKKPRNEDLRDIMLGETHSVAVPRRFPQRHSRVGRGLFRHNAGWQSFVFCQSSFPGGSLQWVAIDGHPFIRQNKSDELLAAARTQASGSAISAPVPGKIVKILVKAKDAVQERQVVLILESMKMEFEVQASRAGHIGTVLVQAGQQVQADEQLVIWEQAPDT